MASIVHDPATSGQGNPNTANVRLRKCPKCQNTIAADNFECPRCGCSLRWFWVRRVVTWGALLAVGAWVLRQYGVVRFF